MMATELKPCPFCGSKDVDVGFSFPQFGEQAKMFVVCNICGSRTANFRKKSTAIEIWNVRAENG